MTYQTYIKWHTIDQLDLILEPEGSTCPEIGIKSVLSRLNLNLDSFLDQADQIEPIF